MCAEADLNWSQKMDEYHALAAYLIFARDLAHEVKENAHQVKDYVEPVTMDAQTASQVFRCYVELFRSRERKQAMNEFLTEAANALLTGASIVTFRKLHAHFCQRMIHIGNAFRF